MLKKYSRCVECKELFDTGDLVFAWYGIEDFEDREYLQQYIDNGKKEVEMYQVCKNCSAQCYICKDRFDNDALIIERCGDCQKDVCVLDWEYCIMCEDIYCHPIKNKDYLMEKQLLDPLSTDMKTCYEKHRYEHMNCYLCEKPNIILFDDEDSHEVGTFCPRCYPKDKYYKLGAAMERPSCAYTKEEEDRRYKEWRKYADSTPQEQKKTREEFQINVRKNWDGYYLLCDGSTYKPEE